MMNMMIDIETLDTRSTAVVLSVGWCFFDSNSISPPTHYCMDLDTQFEAGRTLSQDTLFWWMKQSEEARAAAFDPSPDRLSPDELGINLRMAIHANKVDRVWSHGPAFDMATLSSLLGGDAWDFRSLRDTRTMAMLVQAERPQPKVPHDAGSDAEAQAKWVATMARALGVRL